MPDILAHEMALQVSDGSSMNAFVARPVAEGRHPGIIVFQEAFGVNEHIQDVAERLARHGFVAVAPELYHRTAPGYRGSYTNIGPSLELMKTLTEPGLLADAQAVHEWFQHDPGTAADRVGCVGFCMGGRVSFLVNTVLPLRAAVSFYGAGIANGLTDRAPDLKGAMLFFWGGKDVHIGTEAPGAVAKALHEAGKAFVNVEFSEADHGFFCNFRSAFHAPSARQAEALLFTFLHDHLHL